MMQLNPFRKSGDLNLAIQNIQEKTLRSNGSDITPGTEILGGFGRLIESKPGKEDGGTSAIKRESRRDISARDGFRSLTLMPIPPYLIHHLTNHQ